MNKTNLINMRKSLVCCALFLGATNVANAATGTFDVSFRTITDVTIVETQGLNFGNTMFNTNGGVCNMIGAAAQVNDTDAAVNGPGVTTGTAGSVSGTGCTTAAETGQATNAGNQVGIYTVGGITGASVKVTVNELIGTDFDYSPNAGCISNYDGASGGDTCQSFFIGTPLTTDLANATDGGDAEVTDAELRVVLGGRITIKNDLTSDTNYAEQFTIDATY